MSARLIAIYTTAEAGAPLAPVDEAVLEAGGLVGDRYHRGVGSFAANKPDQELTLIESEEIDRFNRETRLGLGYGALRRNLVTAGVRLNDLVGREFRIGESVLAGIELCEPCAYLARTVAKEVLPGLVHKAGLRARIVRGGTIRPGDSIDASGPT
jgi:MOSC domain-containing protein YiiM